MMCKFCIFCIKVWLFIYIPEVFRSSLPELRRWRGNWRCWWGIRMAIHRILQFLYCILQYRRRFLTHGYSVGVFASHRYHSISISAFFCVLIASSLLCAPGGNRLDQSRTSLEDFSREPVRPVYTLDLLFICSNLHCKNCSAFIEKEFIPVAFLSYTCNYYNRLYLIASTNFAISRFTDFIGSFVVSELSVWHITLQWQLQFHFLPLFLPITYRFCTF